MTAAHGGENPRPPTLDDLRRLISRLDLDPDRHTYASTFKTVWAGLFFASRNSPPSHLEELQACQFIMDDLGNACTIVKRACWMQRVAVGTPEELAVQMEFLGLEVHLFHVEIRSLMDYAVQFIRFLAPRPGEMPDSSFRKLRNWTIKPDNAEASLKCLGEDLRDLIAGADWFEDIRAVRDGFVHRGDSPIVLADSTHLCFQVFGPGLTPRIRAAVYMYNEHVADFYKYAAYYLLYVMDFLERLGELARANWKDSLTWTPQTLQLPPEVAAGIASLLAGAQPTTGN